MKESCFDYFKMQCKNEAMLCSMGTVSCRLHSAVSGYTSSHIDSVPQQGKCCLGKKYCITFLEPGCVTQHSFFQIQLIVGIQTYSTCKLKTLKYMKYSSNTPSTNKYNVNVKYILILNFFLPRKAAQSITDQRKHKIHHEKHLS